MGRGYRKIKHLYAYITEKQFIEIFELIDSGEILDEEDLEVYLDDHGIGFVYSLACSPRGW